MPNAPRTGDYYLPPIIQAMANVMFRSGQAKYKIHHRVSRYLAEYSRGITETERQSSRDRVRRRLTSNEEILLEFKRLKG